MDPAIAEFELMAARHGQGTERAGRHWQGTERAGRHWQGTERVGRRRSAWAGRRRSAR